jgi:hypothetical protein
MPSTSPAQKRLMAAAAHTKGGFGGVPQSVGKDFNEADTNKRESKKFNKGGSLEPITAKKVKPAGKSGWKRWGDK